MKRSVLFLTVLFLVSATISSPAAGQARSKEDMERELRMQEEIDAHKKAIAEQKKSAEELKKLREPEEGDVEIPDEALDETLKKALEQFGDMKKYRYIFRDFDHFRNRPFVWHDFDNPGAPFVFTPESDFFPGKLPGPNAEKSAWELSRTIKEKSFSNDYTYDVDPSSGTVVMAVNGDCRAGEIRIKITMPNGKTYSDIAIDEFGNLNWKKSFKVSDEENQDKTGVWKFQVNASKATGFFRISLLTY